VRLSPALGEALCRVVGLRRFEKDARSGRLKGVWVGCELGEVGLLMLLTPWSCIAVWICKYGCVWSLVDFFDSVFANCLY
jgi:hypothetical protein